MSSNEVHEPCNAQVQCVGAEVQSIAPVFIADHILFCILLGHPCMRDSMASLPEILWVNRCTVALSDSLSKAKYKCYYSENQVKKILLLNKHASASEFIGRKRDDIQLLLTVADFTDLLLLFLILLHIKVDLQFGRQTSERKLLSGENSVVNHSVFFSGRTSLGQPVCHSQELRTSIFTTCFTTTVFCNLWPP